MTLLRTPLAGVVYRGLRSGPLCVLTEQLRDYVIHGDVVAARASFKAPDHRLVADVLAEGHPAPRVTGIELHLVFVDNAMPLTLPRGDDEDQASRGSLLAPVEYDGIHAADSRWKVTWRRPTVRLSRRPAARRAISWCGVGPVRQHGSDFDVFVTGVAVHAGPWVLVVNAGVIRKQFSVPARSLIRAWTKVVNRGKDSTT